MKLLHIADLHLDSPLNTHLSPANLAIRKTELLGTLRRAVSFGVEKGCEGVLIAGDLFDDEKVSRRALAEVESVLASYPALPFYYLCGNHEGDALTRYGLHADNLHIFGETFSSFVLGDVTIHGATETWRGMFDTLSIDKTKKNVVLLHGELRDRSDKGGVIGILDAAGRGIDYLALGHYHTYREQRIDARGVAVYAGVPEGRGFDECGKMGVVILDTDDMSHMHYPICRREIHDVEVNIADTTEDAEVRARIDAVVDTVPREDYLRITLTGALPLGAQPNFDALRDWYNERTFCFRLENRTTVRIEREDLAYDKSLFGEFARLVLEDEGLSEEEKSEIIACGSLALAGEEWVEV